MYDVTNPLSANSYTNKDFQSIYVELLETAKKIAYKWDPTISNESDPGVVLLKLNAIIGDKNNYNIDKNVLENFPETFTQEMSARSNYRQLGYRMPWYKAATVDISFKWVGRKLEAGETVTIPKYTMLTSSDDTIAYTTVRDCVLGNLDGVMLQDSAMALQGTITQLKISGNSVITLSNIDSKNRLYINDTRIAENGIFITGVGNSNGKLWEQVQNVELQPSNSLCYEFDIDPINGVPYIQFADDIRNTIGNGLTIRYIVTNGYDGNVSSNFITKFYDESSIDIVKSNSVVESVPLSADNVTVYNLNGSANGADPETVEEAYHSFKKRVATFDTLVTLRDYVNAIYSSGYVSNVIVSDRTTDIQSSYKIFDKNESSIIDCVTYQVNDSDRISFAKKTSPSDYKEGEMLYKWDTENGMMVSILASNPVEDFEENYRDYYYKVEDEQHKKMDAFDLKFYMLKSGGLLTDWDSYNKTFEIDDSYVTSTLINSYLDDNKSIQHNVKSIEPYTPFMIQNVYPIKLKIVPAYKLKDTEMKQVETNVWNALAKLLNSRNCEFGVEPSYDLIYNVIASCDERIKVVIMDDLEFTTFAMYLDTSGGNRVFKSIPISDYGNCERIISRSGEILDDVYEELTAVLNRIRSSGSKTVDDISEKNYLFVDSTHGIIYVSNNGVLEEYSDKLKEIRKQIIVKNILAGVTPLFEDKSKFDLSIGMKEIDGMTKPVDNITTSLEICPFGKDAEFNPDRLSETYTLRENENLRFLAPSFLTDATYSNYVKFELVLAKPTSLNLNYVYADPEDVTELFDKYERSQFYVKTGNEFQVVRSTGYAPLQGGCPTFKLDSYFGRKVSSGNVSGARLLTEYAREIDISEVGEKISSSSYVPNFEPGLYYTKYVADGSNSYQGKVAFVPATMYPSDWETEDGGSYSDYYRLKQYVLGYIPLSVYFDVNDGVPSFNSTVVYAPSYVETPKPNVESEWDSTYYHSSTTDSYPVVAVDVDSEDWWATWKATLSEYYFEVENPDTTGDNPNSTIVDKLVDADGNPNKKMYTVVYDSEGESYDVSDISDWEDNWSDYYYPDKETPLKNSEHDVLSPLAIPGEPRTKEVITSYYEIMQWEEFDDLDTVYSLKDELEVVSEKPDNWDEAWRNYYTTGNKCEYSPDKHCFELVGGYFTNVYRTVYDSKGVVVGYEMVRDSSSISDTGEYVEGVQPGGWDLQYQNYIIRHYDYKDGSVGYLNVSKTVPTFRPNEIFQSGVINSDGSRPESDYALADVPENWETDYTKYYVSTDEQAGLLDNSLTMRSWIAGRTTLYVPELTFRIPANTEYQLQEGDFLLFFWRETDENDAPYNFVKYNHIYDSETGAPTIIKASFAINASPLSECHINPQGLASSGKIYYEAGKDSPFQVISGMYGAYDLSGTKKIEMRKMNSVKMNSKDNKYFYFISRNKEVVEDAINGNEEKFKLTLNRAGVRNNNYVKYTYVLENDEYFIYTNSSKTGFEALGAGTLIEYYEYFTGEEPENPSKVFYAPVIDSQKIAYNGIDAFMDDCSEVVGKNRFELIEQQIYSFTNKDKIHIQLGKEYTTKYEPVKEGDDLGGEQLYTVASDYTEIGTITDSTSGEPLPPPFLNNYYYLKNGEVYEVIPTMPQSAPDFYSITCYRTENDYTSIVTDCPDDWESNYMNYYVASSNNAFRSVEGISLWTVEYFARNHIYIKSGETWSAVPSGADTDGLTLYKKVQPTYPKYNSTPSLVRGYSVSYASSNSNSDDSTLNGFESLPKLSLTNEDYCWRVSAHLNLSTDEDRPQKIEPPTENSVQSVTIGETTYPTDVDSVDPTNPLYLVTSITLDKVGGDNVDVSWVDLTNSRHPIDVFAYQLNPVFSDHSKGWSYMDSGEIRLELDVDKGATESRTINNISLTEGFKYILPITLYPSSDMSSVSISIENDYGSLQCLCHDSGTMGEDKHFVCLPSNTENLTIYITNNSTSKQKVNVKFGFLFKYTHRDLFEGDTKNSSPKYDIKTSEILEEIRNLDVPRVFDYTHIPDANIRIDDPLSAASFFEPQHVFNAVTIPRAELRFSNQLGSDLPFDSSILFVNNR